MAVNVINFRLQDAETDTKLATLPLYVPTGLTLAQYQTFADAAAEAVDNVTGSEITGIDMTLALTLPGGLKASPVAASLNERGGILGMETSGQFNDSVRIPAILVSLMPGDTFDPAAAAVNTFRLILVAGDGIVIPKTRDGFEWEGSGLYGSKSFRRK